LSWHVGNETSKHASNEVSLYAIEQRSV